MKKVLVVIISLSLLFCGLPATPVVFATAADPTLDDRGQFLPAVSYDPEALNTPSSDSAIPSGTAIQTPNPLSVFEDPPILYDPPPTAQIFEVHEGESIQAAIDQAQSGDQVLVHAGTYHEHLVLKQGVTLSGEDAATTIIHGDYDEAGIPVILALGNNVIENLTITGGRNEAALKILGDHVIIRGNRIQYNSYFGVYNAAAVADVLIERNLFYGNASAIPEAKHGNVIQYNTITGYETAPTPRITAIHYLSGRGLQLEIAYSKDIYSYFIQYSDDGGQTWNFAGVEVEPDSFQNEIVLANPSGTTYWVDDGSKTSPGPLDVETRWYRVFVAESFLSDCGIGIFGEGEEDPWIHGNIITNQRQSVYERTAGSSRVENNILFNNEEQDSAQLPPAISPPSGSGWTNGNMLVNPQFVDPGHGDFSVPETSVVFGRGAFLPEIMKFALERADSALDRRPDVSYTIEEIRSGQLLTGWRFRYSEGSIETFYSDGTSQLDTTPPAIVILSATVTKQATYLFRYAVDGLEYSETRNLVEGSNTLTVQAEDMFGNTATQSFTVTLDTLHPVVVVDPATPHLINTKTLTVSYTVDGVLKTKLFSDLQEGVNTLTITEGLTVVNWDVTVDTVPPVVVVDPSTQRRIMETSFTIHYTSDGVAKQKVFTGLVEGPNTLTITETDLAGNQTIVNWVVTVITTLPAFTWIYNGVGAGLWSIGANWWGGVAPGALDTAIFGLYTLFDCVIDAALTVANITITSDYTGTITQQANVNVTGNFSQASGHWIDANPTSHTFSVGGSFSLPDTTSAFNRYGAQVSGAYQVRDVYDLQGMKGFRSSSFRLEGDIDTSSTVNWNSGAGFDPVGNSATGNEFRGAFDGFGFTLNGITINRSSEDYVGLFGYTKNSSISNLGLLDINISGKNYVGGLTGSNSSSTISNSYTTGTITGTSSVGGLSGNSGAISNSYSTAAVTGSGSRIGGLVGAGGSITGSHATGAVRGNGYTGGLLGYSWGASINSSYATGNVTGTSGYIGGLVGYNRGGAISKSYATGVVRGSSYVGGLVGFNYSYAHITDSYATGSVTGTGLGDTDVGGLAGANEYYSTILNSYATGAVSGYKRIGGLTGFNWDHATITNSFTTSTVTGTTEVGGLTGCQYCTGTESNSYFTDSHRNGKGIYEPLGPSAFYGSTHAVYAGATPWDFTSTWDAFPLTFPHLKWEYYTPLSAPDDFESDDGPEPEPDPETTGIVNGDFSENTTGTPFPNGWVNRMSGGTLPGYMTTYDGKTGVVSLSNNTITNVGLKQEYADPITLDRFSQFGITFKIVSSATSGDGNSNIQSPVILILSVRKLDGTAATVTRYFNYSQDGDSASNPKFVLVPQNEWVTKTFLVQNLGLVAGDQLTAVEILSRIATNGGARESYVDSVSLAFNQVPPVTLTLNGVESGLPYGENMTVTAAATPAVDSYQWYLDDVLIPGATTSTVTVGSSLALGLHELTLNATLGGVVTTQSASFKVIDLAQYASLDITGPFAPSTTAHWTQNISTFVHSYWDPSTGTTIIQYYPIEGNSYNYETSLKLSRSYTAWDPPSQNGYTSENRTLVEFNLLPWYQLGLDIERIARIELQATVSGNGVTFQGYDFSIHAMTALEDGLFASAQDDFLVGTTCLRTIRGLQLNSTPQNLRWDITDLLRGDFSSESVWSGVLFKSDAANLPLMQIASLSARVYYKPPATIHVHEGESIQAAIDQAQSGDTVIIDAGVYQQSFVLKPGVNLQGESKETTIIDGQGQSQNIIVAQGNNRIENLTITGGAAYNGTPYSAIRIEGDNVVIANNIIKDNLDYAVYLRSGQNAVIEHNLFSNNYLAIQHPHSSVTGASIRYNTIVGSNIGINLLDGVTPTISYNIITGSTFSAIYEFNWNAWSSGQLSRGFALVTNNVFYNNNWHPTYYTSSTPPAVETLTSGNIQADPLFVNPAQGDYHLQSGSPALGKGAFPNATTTITGVAYNQSAITRFPYIAGTTILPELTGGNGSTNGTLDSFFMVDQYLPTEFRLNYDFPGYDDYAFAEINSRYLNPYTGYVWGVLDLSAGLVFAMNGLAGKQLRVDVVDDQGKTASFFLNLTGARQNYSLNFAGMGINAARVQRVIFQADKTHMATCGRALVETKGIAFIPIADGDTEISGAAYDPTAITPLSGFPVLSSGSGSNGGTSNGTITLTQASSRNFSFNYTLADSDDFVFAQIANGSFDGQGIWTGTTMDLSNGVVFAVSGPAGKKLNLEVVDNLGNRKIVYLILTGTKQNYVLQTAGWSMNTAHVAQIIFKANKLTMPASGTITVETAGLYYVPPIIPPGIYDQSAITQLSGLPALSSGSGSTGGTSNGTIALTQSSSRDFSFDYTLADSDDFVYSQMNWGNFQPPGVPRISGIHYVSGTGLRLTIEDPAGVDSYNIQYSDNGGETWQTAKVSGVPVKVPVSGTGTTTWLDDGSSTSPSPLDVVNGRWYRVVVAQSHQVFVGTPQDLSGGITFAVNGPAGSKLRVEVMDVLGKRAIVFLSLTGTKQNYVLQSGLLDIDTTRVAQILFTADKTNMPASGTVTVETKGLYYVRAVSPDVYNQAAITNFAPLHYPEVYGGNGSSNGTIDSFYILSQSSSKEFRLSYDFPGYDDYAFAEIDSRDFSYPYGEWVWYTFDLSAGLVIAAQGPAGKQLKVDVVDNQGKTASFFLNLTGVRQNYVLNFAGMGIDAAHAQRIIYTTDKEHMGTRGWVLVETKGLDFILNPGPPVTGTIYNPTAITQLPGLPALSSGSGSSGGTADGTITLTQSSSRDFSFDYTLADGDDFVFSQIANGSFDGQGIWTGTTMDLSSDVVLAVSGPVGGQLRVEFLDDFGNRDVFYLMDLSGAKQNYVLEPTFLNIDETHVAQIIFKVDLWTMPMPANGMVTVETKGLYYVPVIEPAVNPNIGPSNLEQNFNRFQTTLRTLADTPFYGSLQKLEQSQGENLLQDIRTASTMMNTFIQNSVKQSGKKKQSLLTLSKSWNDSFRKLNVILQKDEKVGDKKASVFAFEQTTLLFKEICAKLLS